MPESSPDLPADVLDVLTQRPPLLFVGQDLPLGFMQGIAPPSRQELARALAHLGKLPSSGSLADVTQQFQAHHGRPALNRQAVELLGRTEFRPTTLHQAIAALPTSVIFTAAQDQCLEQALTAAGRAPLTALLAGALPDPEVKPAVLYKLLGCVSSPDSLVLTPPDQRRFHRRLIDAFRRLRYLFAARPVLFINFDPDDALFQMLYDEVSTGLAGRRPQTYALWPTAAPEDIDHWAREGLTVLPYPALDFLEALGRQASRPAQAPAGSVAAPGPLRKPPYKFLAPYTRDDDDLFFGRERESLSLSRLVLSHPLTLLFGAAGAGKTSLLHAGLTPKLEALGYSVVCVRSWGDPLQALQAEVLRWLEKQGRAADPAAVPNPAAAALTLRAFLEAVLSPQDRLVLCLDQFEAFFLRLDPPIRQRFWQNLAAVAAGRPAPAGESGAAWPEIRFVLCLREEQLAFLDEARADWPELLADSCRLTNLTEMAASAAIAAPAARAGLEVAPDLVLRLLADLRKTSGPDRGTVAPPQLQIVCDRLYRDCLADPAAAFRETGLPALARTTLTVEDYERLGGAGGLLASWLDDALAGLPEGNARPLGVALLKALASSPAGLDGEGLAAKLAEAAAPDLQPAGPQAAAGDVLAHLIYRRLVHRFDGHGQPRYELAHAYLANEVEAWLERDEVQAKMVHALLSSELERWHTAGLLLPPQNLKLIHARRLELHQLSPAELELILRSSLALGFETAYWSQRALAGGAPVAIVALEAAQSADYRIRVAAVTLLGQIGPAYLEAVIERLADTYPQVRLAAIRILERLLPSGEWRQSLKYECFVPAGKFILGDLKEAHEVFLEAFYIGRYPVTNADYQRYQAEVQGPFQFPADKADHPVVDISWSEAEAYARWAGLRLITEAEFEKAASWDANHVVPKTLLGRVTRRAGDKGRKRLYPWGDAFDTARSNTYEAGVGTTTPVGRYSPAGDSPYGCADMAGNVWEWTSTLRQDYPYQADDGREDPTVLGRRVVRGGAFHDLANYAVCTFRLDCAPDFVWSGGGFRVGFSASVAASATG